MVAEGVNGIASVVYTGHGAPLALNRPGGASLAFDYDGVQRPVVRGFLFPAPASNVTWVRTHPLANMSGIEHSLIPSNQLLPEPGKPPRSNDLEQAQ